MKKLLLLVLVLIMLISLTSCKAVRHIDSFMWGFSSHDIGKYEKHLEKTEYASEYIPDLEELGEYSAVSYSYQYTPVLLFESRSIALFVEYPEAMYEDRKAALLSRYNFIEETIISEDGESYQSPPASFNYGEYSFRTALDPDVFESIGSACKSFALVGYNDEKSRLAICCFYDLDLDTLGTTDLSENEMISDFIDDFFDWNDLP